VAHHPLTGVLLVGGASRRFGSPKALASLDGETLAERAWRLLGESCDERIAVGKHADGLPLPFEIVDDGSDVRAPIAGVVAGLRAATHDRCVVVPVDCPWLRTETVRLLGERVAVPQTGPLPGGYVKSMLPELERRLQAGELSLRGVNEQVVDVDAAELRDVDVPAELRDDLGD
jgi:molybdopterin-guanine dinucleotide biosynthesis protein A